MLGPFKDMLFSLLQAAEISEPALLWESSEESATLLRYGMPPDLCLCIWGDSPLRLPPQPSSLALADLVKLM